MPREFVYVLTLDDAQVLEIINKIDNALVQLGQRAGRSLEAGSGIGRGLEREATQVARASRNITQSLSRITAENRRSSQALVRDRQDSLSRLADLQEQLSREIGAGDGSKASAERQRALRVEISQVKALIQAQSQRVRVSKEIEAEQRRQIAQAEKGLRQQATLERRLSRERSQQARLAVRDFSRLLQTFPAQARQVDNLVRRYGRFNAVLGRTESEANDLDRAFSKIIASNKKLASEAKNITDRFGEVTVSVRQFQRSVPSGGLPAVFKGAALVSVILAIQSAITSLIRSVTELTTAFVTSSLRTASEFENVRASLNAVFGSIATGSAVFDTIRKSSTELGSDLTLITRRILPFVSSLREAREIGELVTDLARLDPEQGTQGALLALNDALVGQFRSLRERFEIPIGNIGDLQDQFGQVDGLIKGVRENLDAVGISFDVLGDTFDVNLGKVAENFRNIRGEFGEPVLDVINQELKEFTKFLEDNDESIRKLFRVLGIAVADTVEGVSNVFQNFIKSVDIDQLTDSIASVFPVLTRLLDDIAEADFSNINTFLARINQLNDSLIIAGSLARQTVTILSNPLPSLIASGEIGAVTEYALAIAGATDDISKLLSELDPATNSIIKQAEAVKQQTDAELALADAILATRFAIKERDELQLEFNEKKAEALEKEKELNRELASETLQQQRALANRLNELAIDTSQKRRDAFIKQFESQRDALSKFTREIVDSTTKFNRAEEDALLKQARKLEDLDAKEKEKREDLEEEHQRKLRDIRNKFDQEALEAILANDAVRLREIRRRQQFEEEQAEVQRRDDEADISDDTAKESAKIAIDFQRDLEDAGIALTRRGQDLVTAFRRQRADLQQSLQDEFASIAQSEVDKRAELARQHQFRLSEARIQNQETLDLLQAGLNDQLAAITLQQQKVTQLILEQQQARRRILLQNRDIPLVTLTGDSATQSPRSVIIPGDATPRDVSGFRQFGGAVLSGQEFIVGENGPELVRFPASATIEPNLSRLRFSPLSNQGSRIDNSRNISAEIGLSNLSGLSPIQLAEVKTIVVDILQRAIL